MIYLATKWPNDGWVIEPCVSVQDAVGELASWGDEPLEWKILRDVPLCEGIEHRSRLVEGGRDEYSDLQ